MNIVKKAVLGVRLIGLKNIFRSLRYSILRDRLEARYIRTLHQKTPENPGKLLKTRAFPGGAHFQFERAELKINFLADDLVFVAWNGAGISPSYAVIKTIWAPVETSLEKDGDGWIISSHDLKIQVGATGSLHFLSSTGKLLRFDEPPQKSGIAWKLSTHLDPLTCVYGLGERSMGLNLRPGSYRLWNTDPGGSYGPGVDPLYICMPLYLCLDENGCHLVFYDNSFDGQVDFGEKAGITFEGGPLRYYLAAGTPESVLTRLGDLTGRAPLPPRWAFGYHQSRWGYGSEAEMRRVYDIFRTHKLPLSGLFMDIDHLCGFRTLTLDETSYPNLQGFAEELRFSDVHLIAITNPGVKVDENYDLFQEGINENAFCKQPDGSLQPGVVWPGWAVHIDTTNPQVRKWWGKQYARHLKHGIDGFWHDMNEPAIFTAWGGSTLPLSTQHAMDGRGGDHREAHNIYGLLMNQAGYEGLRQLQPAKRPFILSRSGWVGMQRYSWAWTGDVETSWNILRQTPAGVLGLSLSGMPYTGPDIGGFSGHPSEELFIRWFQLSSFLPFFRTHCALFLPKREPCEFGENVVEIIRAQLELRYRLIPYWYTLAWQTSQTGLPLVRPLFWDEPENNKLWNIDDAFLLGRDLLVAPILKEGATRRQIDLPGGSWYEYENDHLHLGGQKIELEAPIEHIPVLVRAGAILPLAENGGITIHVYRPQKNEGGEGFFFSDAGDGFEDCRLDKFSLLHTENGYDFVWNGEGAYSWNYANTRLRLHGFPAENVKVDGEDCPMEGVEICPQALVHISWQAN
jgi:alpha-glucosidase